MSIVVEEYAPQHGVDGWDLVEQDWNPDNGVATLTYERVVPKQAPEVFVKRVRQPIGPQHEGWPGS